MDQSAFRQLLSAKSSSGSAASSSTPGNSSGSSSSHMRAFGVAPKRPTASATGRGGANVFQPRKVEKQRQDSRPNHQQGSKKKKASSLGEGYVDRAEARRRGDKDEFADAEKLLEGYKSRNEGRDASELEEEMRHLGGDEKHSVLVKGLDFALLQANKEKLRGEGRVDAYGHNAIEDDDLEAAFAQGVAGARTEPEAHLTDQGPLSAASDEFARAKMEGKFKPIGLATGSNEKPEYKIVNGKRMRKKRKNPPVEAALPAPAARQATDPAVSSRLPQRQPEGRAPTKQSVDVNTALGEPSITSALQRTPKKPHKNVASQTTTGDNQISDSDVERQPERESASVKRAEYPALSVEKAPTPALVAASSSIPQDPLGDDDEDIFAGAGEWVGVADDEDEEFEQECETIEEDDCTLAQPSKIGSGKRGWFADFVTEKDSSGTLDIQLPSGLSNILDSAKASSFSAVPGAAVTTSSADAARPKLSASTDKSAAGPAGTGRLQGFSDSALPSEVSREMLKREMEREGRRAVAIANARRDRKAKRAHAGAGAGPNGEDGERVDGDEGRQEKKRRGNNGHSGGGGDAYDSD
ncbi:hypothetical protein K437DRAFT_295483 [Tilletiaria anomala UBC 951]|uniref:RED-like N-terminal domain-containing protein n=1 Tax=Tilletiaria anomala (strain ATCC 24038 / CBS 436.72 / UBC 951) TaxID=1037660 RepID=A0A066VNL7_TILAU|nr:uncharacterized protein K437DRAFT_295483 [Tilletiaria anomala UBC 951]KDN41863.1 hypothetical protein K437DRAFT_295483 [Tilletiaria anomala UBC 951]